ncbi:hypothetical protein MSG28_006539 [Choristoneura fumiferana]|uniref:Uncharacterized protein n=1 Tax=Choristoneura fumiferana TaxID=7141 RepID=A0ACC0JFC3_CHOFU|nr:hypothetical protein MSG28_006539 [Choristoneura fumiferana]
MSLATPPLRISFLPQYHYHEFTVTVLDSDGISLSIPSMRCISVVGERPGLVRRLTGACAGPSVTLSVAAAAHFTVNVYAK